MDACSALSQAGGFVGATTGYIDCQAQQLGSGAWQALAAPGSTLTVVLTGFLTIFIAVIGYNLLFGRVMSVREGTLAFVKIGAVFALATSWPAYRTLVYDLVTDGPAQLVAEIGPAAGIVGSDGTLLQRLDLTDRALAQLALLGPGSPPPGSMTEIVPPPFAGFDAFALGGSRILFLLTAVGALAAVRVVTGLMLALGPFFIAFLMFDSTRSLFEGWIRVIAGAALAAIGVTIGLGLELALVEPWLGDVLARRMAGEAVPTAPTELFVLVTLFTIIVMAAIYGCARVARAFRISPRASLIPLGLRATHTTERSMSSNRQFAVAAAQAERSRAAQVANLLMTTSRRESSTVNPGASPAPARPSIVGRNSEHRSSLAPVGRTFARRSTSRVSARAARRDMSA
jgi:type IV secretion system protein VirB6